MTLKIGVFQPIVVAVDNVPPLEYGKMFDLTEDLHSRPELNDSNNPAISIRGGQQIQVYPNAINMDVSWLITFLETECQKYIDTIIAQSGAEELKLVRPVITSIWTIRQVQESYQELHSHPGGNLSGNIYISVPELDDDSKSSDCKIGFRFPQSKDIGKFIMNDSWRYTPAQGTLIMFPSYLPHTVYPWRGKGHRTVIAFDARLVNNNE
jgi:uncharacterized protein (TIGR02466 family)